MSEDELKGKSMSIAKVDRSVWDEILTDKVRDKLKEQIFLSGLLIEDNNKNGLIVITNGKGKLEFIYLQIVERHLKNVLSGLT